jgi:hypothetical protein
LNWRLRYVNNKILERIELVKDVDPFNKQLLNDAYDTIIDLSNKLDTLEKQLYELAGTEQKL